MPPRTMATVLDDCHARGRKVGCPHMDSRPRKGPVSMLTTQQPRYHWRKSTHSNEANCVEIGTMPGAPVLVRDTKDLDRTSMLSFNRDAWRSFLDSIR
jgi:hypothetical protein